MDADACLIVAEEARSGCEEDYGDAPVCEQIASTAYAKCAGTTAVPPGTQVCNALPMHLNRFDLLSRQGVEGDGCWQQTRVHPLSWPSSEGKAVVLVGSALGVVGVGWQALQGRVPAFPPASELRFSDVAAPVALLLPTIPMEIQAKRGTAQRNLARSSIQLGAVSTALGVSTFADAAVSATGSDSVRLESSNVATVSAASFAFAETWTLAHGHHPLWHTLLFLGAAGMTGAVAASDLTATDGPEPVDVAVGATLGLASGITVPLLHTKAW
ncbi:MAG: hypothetical protein H6738_03705 [Alphaproteobacteria bacterium]|nr:hypothetical protein [Alphaproteobacteria bacterium]MCB9695874.1 hypothetical protein [Alphaproteobacteria bacterium]